jgi:hypothetical protein
VVVRGVLVRVPPLRSGFGAVLSRPVDFENPYFSGVGQGGQGGTGFFAPKTFPGVGGGARWGGGAAG